MYSVFGPFELGGQGMEVQSLRVFVLPTAFRQQVLIWRERLRIAWPVCLSSDQY